MSEWDNFVYASRAMARKLAGAGAIDEEYFISYSSALRAAAGGVPSAVEQVRAYEFWCREKAQKEPK
jgi:hypothetical protein